MLGQRPKLIDQKLLAFVFKMPMIRVRLLIILLLILVLVLVLQDLVEKDQKSASLPSY